MHELGDLAQARAVHQAAWSLHLREVKYCPVCGCELTERIEPNTTYQLSFQFKV